MSMFGLGFRPPHYSEIVEKRPKVGWFEIISENFLGGGRPRNFVEKLRESYPVACHGVGLSIGSSDPLNLKYLEQLKALVDWCKPFLVTDHLCWTTHRGHNTHDLLPIPYTEESLVNVVTRVSQAQDYLGRQILLENPSAYVSFAASSMNEAEFLAEVVRRSGCGILLDVNNLFVNACNLGLNPIAYLEALPVDSVQQFHLAGHTTRPDVRIDTHDQEIVQEVWDLFQIAAARWPKVPTMIEWDDHIPPFAILAEKLDRARKVHSEAITMPSEKLANLAHQLSAHVSALPKPGKSEATKGEPLVETQNAFVRLMTASAHEPVIDQARQLLVQTGAVTSQTGAEVYNFAYFSRIHEVIADLFKGVAFLLEDDDFKVIVADYLSKYPPADPNITEAGRHFAAYLALGTGPVEFGVDPRIVADLACLAWTRIESFNSEDHICVTMADIAALSDDQWDSVRFRSHPSVRRLSAHCQADVLLEELEAGSLPEPPDLSRNEYLVCRKGFEVQTLGLSHPEAQAFDLLDAGATFSEIPAVFADADDAISDEVAIATSVAFLTKLIESQALGSFQLEYPEE